MPTKSEAIELTFHLERDTKNKIRFQEMKPGSGGSLDTVPKDQAVVEKLYVSKKALKKMGDPTTLTVTIKASS